MRTNKTEKQECQILNEDVDVTDVSETPGNEDYHWEIIAQKFIKSK